MINNPGSSKGHSSSSACDVAIIGAGPYGLAARAALRASDIDIRHFGPPMSFWRERMPAGMLIRSPWVASNFAAPGSGLTLDDYQRACGQTLVRPRQFGDTSVSRLGLDDFVAYGEWFQRRAAPDLDERRVDRLSSTPAGFELEFADGDRVHAKRVIVAAGIERFGRRPSAFADVSAELARHTTDLTDPSAFAGLRVAVVGAGQSALESAALLHEAGANVEVLVRAPGVHWLTRSSRLHRLGPISKLLYAPSDIGPAGLSRLVAMPGSFSLVPRRARTRLDRRAISPAGSGWLVDRLREVQITTGTEIVSAHEDQGRVAIRLRSGSEQLVDRVVLGTGFQIDIARYSFLGSDVIDGVRRMNGYPILSRSFESSVRGLYFVGAPAAGTFGSLLRFVAGSEFAASRLAQHLAGASARHAAPARAALESA